MLQCQLRRSGHSNAVFAKLLIEPLIQLLDLSFSRDEVTVKTRSICHKVIPVCSRAFQQCTLPFSPSRVSVFLKLCSIHIALDKGLFCFAGSKLQLDSSDSRFDALFTSPDFALDPTDPQFAASDGAKKIQKEAASRRAKAKAGTTQARPEKPVQAKLQPDAQGMPPDDKQAKQQGLSPSASHNS